MRLRCLPAGRQRDAHATARHGWNCQLPVRGRLPHPGGVITLVGGAAGQVERAVAAVADDPDQQVPALPENTRLCTSEPPSGGSAITGEAFNESAPLFTGAPKTPPGAALLRTPP